jgi:putative transposase
MYSRKIVGYDLSNSLELNGCVRALNKAIYQAKITKGVIHHSDRGIQYCSNIYTQILKRKKNGYQYDGRKPLLRKCNGRKG